MRSIVCLQHIYILIRTQSNSHVSVRGSVKMILGGNCENTWYLSDHLCEAMSVNDQTSSRGMNDESSSEV